MGEDGKFIMAINSFIVLPVRFPNCTNYALSTGVRASLLGAGGDPVGLN